MKTIWKFLIPIGVHSSLSAPVPGGKDAVIRAAGSDPATGNPTLWIEVDTSQPVSLRRIFAIGTGSEVPPDCDFIGTAICGAFVWHIFEWKSL